MMPFILPDCKSEGGSKAKRLELELKAVVSAELFHSTVAPLTKPVPATVTWIGPEPAVAKDGLIPVTVGTLS